MKEMFKVVVNGVTMVHGPGHLTKEDAEGWVEIYRQINPDLPPDAIYTENTYRELEWQKNKAGE